MLSREWKKELAHKKSPSLVRALVNIHIRTFLLYNMLLVSEEIIRMSQPFIISALLGLKI